MNTLSELVDLIRSPSLRLRTGLWLMPLACLGSEREEAVRMGLDAVDLRQRLLNRLPDGGRFAGLSVETLTVVIDEVTRTGGAYDAVLAYNTDLLLARLSYGDRSRVWQFLRHSMPHRSRGLIVAMPVTADELLPPPEEQAGWREEQRLAT